MDLLIGVSDVESTIISYMHGLSSSRFGQARSGQVRLDSLLLVSVGLLTVSGFLSGRDFVGEGLLFLGCECWCCCRGHDYFVCLLWDSDFH